MLRRPCAAARLLRAASSSSSASAPPGRAPHASCVHEIDAALAALREQALADAPTDVMGYLARAAAQLAGPEGAGGELREAAGAGDVERVATLLQRGCDPNASGRDRRRAVHLACEGGHLPVVESLVAAGADVNIADRWGATPLCTAMRHGHRAIQEYLLAHGAAAGRVRALKSAAPLAGGRAAADVDVAAAVPGDTNSAAAHQAAAGGDVAALERLLDEDPQAVHENDVDLRTPLHAAAAAGELAAVKFLVARGANLHARDRWDATPHADALTHFHNEIAAYFVDIGFSEGAVKAADGYPQERQMTREFWDDTAAATGWGCPARSPVLPASALLLRLRGEYGFKLGGHALLAQEIRSICRGPADPAVARAVGGADVRLTRAVAAHVNTHHALPHDMAPSDPAAREELERALVLYDDYADVVLGGNPAHVRCAADLPDAPLLSSVILDRLRVKNWPSFRHNIRAIYEHVLTQTPNDGATADYIPQLRDADPDKFAVSICTVDGQVLNLGDTDSPFSVQSVGKTFAYTMALRAHGRDEVHKYVGQEPSGRAFNDFALTRDGVPFNPVTNAGAIVTCSLLHPDIACQDARMEPYKAFLSELSGGMDVGDCMDVYASEQGEAFNNYALANFMKARRVFPKHINTHTALADAVEFYLRVCSTKVSTPMLAAIAATYANHGTSPLTGKTLLSESEVKQTLQILASCGMYDYSGEWACTIGMPSKSGVSGGIFVVVPGVAGMCVWSPRLDAIGNSVRGIRFCKAFSEKFRCSVLDLLFRAKDA